MYTDTYMYTQTREQLSACLYNVLALPLRASENAARKNIPAVRARKNIPAVRDSGKQRQEGQKF